MDFQKITLKSYNLYLKYNILMLSGKNSIIKLS
jgi:hypothetical protein